MRVRVRPTRETEKQRRVIVPSRSIGLPAILRLRQRFFVKKKSCGRDTTLSWGMSRTHMRARRTATAESEKRRARRTGARCGEAIRNVRRFELNRGKIGPGKLTTPAHQRRHRRDSLPLPPPANDSRVINRNSGESFSVEKYRIFRVCDARYPVITKSLFTVFRWYVRNREWHLRKVCRLFIDSFIILFYQLFEVIATETIKKCISQRFVQHRE